MTQKEALSMLDLPNGYEMRVDRNSGTLSISSGNGSSLYIRLTAEGPVIEMDAPKVLFKNTGDIAFEAEDVSLQARRNLSIQSGGDCDHRVAGTMRVDVRDDIEFRSQAAKFEAVRGGISLKASDDLDLHGLRILHNVPSEEEVLEKLQKVKTFSQFMACPAWNPNSPKKLEPREPQSREDW